MMQSFVAIPKAVLLDIKRENRPFSAGDALLSYTIDLDCGKKRSLRDYSRMWTWSVGKVKRFISSMENHQKHGTETEQRRNSNGTAYHPVLLGNRGNTEQTQDGGGTKSKHKLKTKTKTKKLPSSFTDEDSEFYETKKKRKLKGDVLKSFLLFWDAFNYKSGKAEAADSWYDLQPINGAMPQIIISAKKEAAAREESRRNGRTPKMAQGWLSGKRFEDESESASGEKFCGSCGKFCKPDSPDHCHKNGGSKACSQHTGG